ncbi:MAG: AAA family ATPase, partial [Dysgonamonadaceae bacterium]|nr:AAA family ATPase [Dysgonamonadaceae bacterium]
MEVKEVIKQNGEYICDIDVTVEDWKEVLRDNSLMTENYKDVLFKFYLETEHKSTCKALGEKYGASPQSYNGTITNFAKAVQKKLNRFEVIGADGNPTFWIIPMLGKYEGEHFEWTLRPELVQALEESKIMEDQYIKFTSFRELIDRINKDLGGFTETFRYKRKDLARLGRASSRGILFKYEDDERDWSINEGGGTEVQYHLFYRGNKVGYGIGFNTQYVPFANKMSTIDYMQPFASSFITLLKSDVVGKLKNKGFKYYGESESELKSLKDNKYYLFGKEVNVTNSGIVVFDFNNMLDELKTDLFELYCNIFEGRNKILAIKSVNMDYLKILESNKNLILTGAPGTGKTYLAKEIAKEMIGVKTEQELIDSGRFDFVQFHPSYDYTDFVEGLRPFSVEEEDNIGFKRKDGIFKGFCKKALKAKISNEVDNFDEAWEELLSKVKDNLANGTLTKIGSWEYGLSTKDSLKYSSVNTKSQYNFTITKQNVYNAYQKIKARPSGAFQKDMEDVVEYMKQNLNLKDFQEGTISSETENNKFIFIIDEINRAEISKVFGELFFSIDPGYRGEKGKVKTQYENLQDADDVFADGFFVPENVYIIGTMNDIDRSVESMDFAMRRRFAWKEVKAEDRISMWDERIENWKDDAFKRMNSLNKAIEGIPSLSSAYHIGPAYFLKLENYQNEINPFD